MNAIDTLLSELVDAMAFEDRLIIGYQEFSSIPSSLLSPEAHVEIAEGLQWSITRSSKLETAINGLNVLKDNGYPVRLQQVAPDAIIAELTSRLALMQLALQEFSLIKGTVTVGPEVPI
jgi:hypothetical protein